MAPRKSTARWPRGCHGPVFTGGRPSGSCDSVLLLPGSTAPCSDSSPTGSDDASQASTRMLGELPDAFIDFMFRDDTQEPLPKRRKTSSKKQASHLEDVPGSKIDNDYVVAQRSVMEIQCLNNKFTAPEVRKLVHFGDDALRGVRNEVLREPDHIIIKDEQDHFQPVIKIPLPAAPVEKEAIRHALAVHSLSKKKEWAIWTELDVVLSSKINGDHLQLIFTVKWNTTPTPYQIAQRSQKPPRLAAAINAFFSDPNGSSASNSTWSPQDFYESAHRPSKDRQAADGLQPQALTAMLYPFQKRAVQWLLRREGVEWVDGNIRKVRVRHDMKALPMTFQRFEDADGRECYISHLFGVVTKDVAPFWELERSLSGGILAEEMGLGKTIEMISLVALHKRSKTNLEPIRNHEKSDSLRPTSATLIITPPSILKQWMSEIKTHAPHFKVIHYKGINVHSKLNAAALLDTLASSDIVVTTYTVLRAEIHFTILNPEKLLRYESKYPRPKSPLMLLSWWRVCLDEAQMVESGVSNAAMLAQMVPRINAWAITGTPVRKDVNDLRGLLMFLRSEPYASFKHVWASLISSHKSDFSALFGRLALRHSKQSVREELRLPAQRRYVITMPFTPVEEQHYQELFTQMWKESALDATGAPIKDDWDPQDYADVMRSFLVRLRRTALHPDIGGKNRRALGRKDRPLRTVDEVLDAMIEQAELAIRTDQRTLLMSKLKRGQLFENSPRVKEALAIWKDVVDEAGSIVKECRENLNLELAKKAAGEEGSSSDNRESLSDSADLDAQESDIDATSHLGALRTRLRASLEVEHIATFFCANAYFQIKSDEDITEPGSEDFKAVEHLETQGYEKAKKLRQEVLQEIFQKADRLMEEVSKNASTQSFVQVPPFPSPPIGQGGLQSRKMVEQLEALGTALDAQANMMDEWREEVIQMLLRPLVDEDEGLEVTGDEYEDSTKNQDEVMAYVHALRSVVADRYDALTGQKNELVEFEADRAINWEKYVRIPPPGKTIELLKARQSMKPTPEMGSVRGVTADLKTMATSLRPDAEHGNVRAQAELANVQSLIKFTQKQWSAQIKTTIALEKEVELFTDVMNTRIEYYRQLQEVSDMVAPYDGPKDEDVLAKMLENEEKLSRKIAGENSKRRYLLHLKLQAADPQDKRTCAICRDPFEVGALTGCGHQFCKECIWHWFASRHNCPVCKTKLVPADLYDVTYKPQQLSIHAEATGQHASPTSTSKSSAIFSDISRSQLEKIKNIELDGPSFTTKVDTMVRHLLWLRDSDPGSKSIIFSQFKEFLDVLAQAFKRFRIGFTSIDKPTGIETFKQDPGIECFLLHARAHSSGLNLVNANHVFLCEPLLNTALELQAIARVDRIGQQQETNVWLYLIDGTVEESIYQLSVKRRMEHMGRPLNNSHGDDRAKTPEPINIDAANSMELQQASLGHLLATKSTGGGELIKNEDLWECLFGTARQREHVDIDGLREDREVGRHLRAEAAGDRMGSA